MVKTIELSLSCNDAELESVKGFLTRSHIPYSLREDKEPELSWVILFSIQTLWTLTL